MIVLDGPTRRPPADSAIFVGTRVPPPGWRRLIRCQQRSPPTTQRNPGQQVLPVEAPESLRRCAQLSTPRQKAALGPGAGQLYGGRTTVWPTSVGRQSRGRGNESARRRWGRQRASQPDPCDQRLGHQRFHRGAARHLPHRRWRTPHRSPRMLLRGASRQDRRSRATIAVRLFALQTPRAYRDVPLEVERDPSSDPSPSLQRDDRCGFHGPARPCRGSMGRCG